MVTLKSQLSITGPLARNSITQTRRPINIVVLTHFSAMCFTIIVHLIAAHVTSLQDEVRCIVYYNLLPRRTMLCYVMICHVTSHHITQRVKSRNVSSCLVTPFHVTSVSQYCHIVIFLSDVTMVTSGNVGTSVSLTQPVPGLCQYYVCVVTDYDTIMKSGWSRRSGGLLVMFPCSSR